MITKYRAALGGVYLDAVDSSIIVQGIDEAAPVINIGTQNRAHGYGAVITSEDIRQRDISIRFAINKKDYTERMNVLQKVASWAAGGGRLIVNYRAGQCIRVSCSALPTAVKGIGGFAEIYTVTFRAVLSPRWEAATATGMTISASSGTTATITVSGDAPTPLMFTAVASASVTTVAVSANGYSMSFSGLTIAAGNQFILQYTNDYIQQILNNGSNAMQYRSTASSDEIWLNPGSNTVTVSSSGAMSWNLLAKARWY